MRCWFNPFVKLPCQKGLFYRLVTSPLSDSQVEYAADDVTYLPTIYHDMVKELTERGRLNWLDDAFAEIAILANTKLIRVYVTES